MRPCNTNFIRRMLVCAVIVIGATSAYAQDKPDQYYTPTLERMIDFMFANGYIDVNDPDQLIDYVRVKDCNLIKTYYHDDFTWNKIKTRILNESKVLQKNVVTHFVVPDTLDIDRYNFKTKAFDISKQSQMNNINSLNIVRADDNLICQIPGSPMSLKNISYVFDLKMDAPLSLHRIPMAESMARYILPELSERNRNGYQTRKVYILIYFTVDGVAASTSSQTLLGGRVDKIEFFLDAERTQRFKRLTYITL